MRIRSALGVLVVSPMLSCSASKPPEPAALVDAPKPPPTASASVEPEELTQPRGLGEDAMCFNAKYSPDALASESSELMQSECEAMGCCNHLRGLQGTPLADADWRRALLQASSMGRAMHLHARGRAKFDVVFPATRLESRSTEESTPIHSCGSWSACGYFVRSWRSRLSVALTHPALSESCATPTDEACAEAAAKLPEADRFSAWYQCIDGARPLTFNVEELGTEAELGAPKRPQQGYLLAHELANPGAFSTALFGTKQALRVDRDGTVWKWEVGCEEIDEALWVSHVVGALSPRRAARSVALPEPMLPIAHRSYPASPRRGPVMDEIPYQWLASSAVGQTRWVQGRGACEATTAYRKLRVEALLRPRRESLTQAGKLGAQYSLAALKCTASKVGSDGCAEFERLMKPLWGKQVCRKLP
ncbi:MAG: hypothetical protein H6718_18655 [Polyangiaceae bacterium]|nr:hypothetical protein [Polyangiaceae bacterium]MCB9605775.1 hypothetical protein [Polyangiaceae bacterium]